MTAAQRRAIERLQGRREPELGLEVEVKPPVAPKKSTTPPKKKKR